MNELLLTLFSDFFCFKIEKLTTACFTHWKSSWCQCYWVSRSQGTKEGIWFLSSLMCVQKSIICIFISPCFAENGNPSLELYSFVETVVLEARWQTLSWKAEYSSVSIRNRMLFGPDWVFYNLPTEYEESFLLAFLHFQLLSLKPHLVADQEMKSSRESLSPCNCFPALAMPAFLQFLKCTELLPNF